MIDEYIDKTQLKYYNNNLECICLLASSDEHSDGLLNHFIEQICSNTQYSGIPYDIDFKIITTNNYEYEEIKNNFNKFFKSIEVVNIYIPNYLNHYFSDISSCKNNVPHYGLKSGPNYIFFETFQTLSMYNTTLFLECDIYLTNDWLNKIINNIKNSNGFWISGSIYDGINNSGIFDILNTHINGGVGLYATGNVECAKFIKFCSDHILETIKSFGPNLPYDYIIKLIIDKYYNSDYENRMIWQFIKRQYVYNNHIINYSPTRDQNKDISEINKMYNYTILHKKPYMKDICNE